MEFNRDFTIAVIREYQKSRAEELKLRGKSPRPLEILDAFAGTGIRAIRFLKEIEDVSKVIINDNDSLAVKLI